MKTDIEIANSIEIKPIYEIADKLGIDRDLLEPYGRYKAKLPLSLIDKSKIDGKKLILVSAISCLLYTSTSPSLTITFHP